MLDLAPVLTVAGPAALVVIVLWYGPRAVLLLMAGIVAIFTSNEEQRKACRYVLDALTHRDRKLPRRHRTYRPPEPSQHRLPPDH